MDLIEELLANVAPDWSTDGYGIDSCLVCPCGYTIEQDGVCPDGCVSPLRRLGLI
jgi:hypothetical protein